MSTTTNDGGPAFPHVNPQFDGNWNNNPQRGGMSLRDYFAAQAMTAILTSGSNNSQKLGESDLPVIAWLSYKAADALLKARGAVS